MGCSRKYPYPAPLWTTLNWVSKNFGIFKKDNCSFCRILLEPVESKSRGIPEFRKTLNGFPGILVKSYRKFYGFPVILTDHFLQDFQCRPWGGGGGGRGCIFSGIAQYCTLEYIALL